MRVVMCIPIREELNKRTYKPSVIPQKRWELEDKLWQLGFSNGLSLEARKKEIAKFVDRWIDNPLFEKWISKVGADDNITNKGAYLRRVLEMGISPEKIYGRYHKKI